MRRSAYLICALVAVTGCSLNYRIEPTPSREVALGVLRPLWNKPLVEPGFLDYKPQEWATAAVGRRGTIFIGSSSKKFSAYDARGRRLWQVALDGAVNSTPLLDEDGGVIYFGADDGRMYAIHAYSGRKLWSWQTQGLIRHRPVLHQGILLFTTSENRLYAVDADNGKWRWQYDRERPDGFTIKGHAGVAVRGSIAYTGFADGVLVALKIATGEVLWTQSLRGDKKQFVDVDTTPQILEDGRTLIAASYSQGVYALSTDSGSIQWSFPLAGVSALTLSKHLVLVAAAKTGLLALDREGHERWRQGHTSAGAFSKPIVFGPYVMVSASEKGLYVASAASGQLLQTFSPGKGISAAPALGAGLVTVLSNGGTLYTFGLVHARDATHSRRAYQ